MQISAFPTAVGMNRQNGGYIPRSQRVPHSRGDEPLNPKGKEASKRRSPQPWG